MRRRSKPHNPLDLAHRELRLLLDSTIAYHSKQDPISRDEKIALWHWDMGQPLLDALELVTKSGYSIMYQHTNTVRFAVPQWDLGIRWKDKSTDGSAFLRLPQHGPFAIKPVRYGDANMRLFTHAALADVLSEQQATKLREWAELAADLGVQILEAKLTASAIFKMTRTPGQLNRMIPALVQYLPELTQQSVAEQERKSPYPDGWAEFDKSKVEQMLVQIARGHLVRSSTDVSSVYGDEFTWAQKLPHA